MNRDPAIESEIRRVAYTIWEAKGRPHGQDNSHWLEAERKIERYFYFSFPRRGKLSADENLRGLDILSSIVQHGLILTPEVHSRREFPGHDREVNVLVVQQRLCLTELSPSELPLHARDFGAFAIEFDIKWCRDIGAFPVLYFPNIDPSNAEGASWFSNKIITIIGYLQNQLLPRLTTIIEEVRNTAHDDEIVIQSQSGGGVSKRITLEILSYLLAGFYLPQEIEPILRASANLWAPTENIKYNNLMHYYQQREWRLTPSITRPGIQYNDPTEDHVQKLLQMDSDYFGREINVPGPMQRAMACKVLREVDGKHVLSYARRLIVPESSRDQAERVITSITDPPRVISLESLR